MRQAALYNHFTVKYPGRVVKGSGHTFRFVTSNGSEIGIMSGGMYPIYEEYPTAADKEAINLELQEFVVPPIYGQISEMVTRIEKEYRLEPGFWVNDTYLLKSIGQIKEIRVVRHEPLLAIAVTIPATADLTLVETQLRADLHTVPAYVAAYRVRLVERLVPLLVQYLPPYLQPIDDTVDTYQKLIDLLQTDLALRPDGEGATAVANHFTDLQL